MNRENVFEKANSYIQKLVGQPLCYGIKSLDLYDFGFGEYVEYTTPSRLTRKLPTYAVHTTCKFNITYRKTKEIKQYDADTSIKQFCEDIQPLIGLKVKRVALNEDNDLWLEIGDCWITFLTFEDDEESWRFFSPHSKKPHLIASNSWLEMELGTQGDRGTVLLSPRKVNDSP